MKVREKYCDLYDIMERFKWEFYESNNNVYLSTNTILYAYSVERYIKEGWDAG